MKFISTLATIAAVGTLVAPGFAQTSPMQHDTMHKPMAHGTMTKPMAHGKMTPQQMKAMHTKMMKHDAMMKHDTMMKHGTMMHKDTMKK